MNGAQAMLESLKRLGVKVLFGYPGAAICPFYDVLYESEVDHILVRQEQNAGHAANGYAQVSDKVGVCVVTSGPGATNLITAIASAYMDSIPIVAITGQVASDLIGRDVFQEADITGACEPFCKYSYLVKDANDIPRIFKEAFYIAKSGRPGPVLIDIPVDIQRQEMNSFEWKERISIRGYKPNVKGNAKQIKNAASVIAKARRPLIVVGGGVYSAGAEKVVRRFAEDYGIKVANTMMGIGVLPFDHPLRVGMIGSFGVYEANNALHNADVVVLVGARVGDRAVSKPGQLAMRARIVHIDVDPAEIGKNMEASIPIVGDARAVFEELHKRVSEILEQNRGTDLTPEQNRGTDLTPEQNRGTDLTESSFEPREFIKLLSWKMEPGSVIVADVGQNQIWAANSFAVENGRLLTSGGMGTMGYSIPAALGARIALEGKDVVAICGDGAFQMSLNELATMVQHGANVKIVLMNNNSLGMVREIQGKLYEERYSQTNLDGNPDFVKLAEAYGIKALRITENSQAESAVGEMLKHDGPFLLECIVSPDEKTP